MAASLDVLERSVFEMLLGKSLRSFDATIPKYTAQ
jgi:hypothetical protein